MVWLQEDNHQRRDSSPDAANPMTEPYRQFAEEFPDAKTTQLERELSKARVSLDDLQENRLSIEELFVQSSLFATLYERIEELEAERAKGREELEGLRSECAASTAECMRIRKSIKCTHPYRRDDGVSISVRCAEIESSLVEKSSPVKSRSETKNFRSETKDCRSETKDFESETKDFSIETKDFSSLQSHPTFDVDDDVDDYSDDDVDDDVADHPVVAATSDHVEGTHALMKTPVVEIRALVAEINPHFLDAGAPAVDGTAHQAETGAQVTETGAHVGLYSARPGPGDRPEDRLGDRPQDSLNKRRAQLLLEMAAAAVRTNFQMFPEFHPMFPACYQMFLECHPMFPKCYQTFPECHPMFPECHRMFPESHRRCEATRRLTRPGAEQRMTLVSGRTRRRQSARACSSTLWTPVSAACPACRPPTGINNYDKNNEHADAGATEWFHTSQSPIGTH
jgi:hypothetical protein